MQSGLVNRLLLQELVPPSVLVNQSGEILHVHGKTGRFLQPAVGRSPVASLIELTRPDLDLHVDAAIRQASDSGESLRRNIQVRTADSLLRVDLRARRVESPRPLSGLVLVTFEVVGELARAPARAEAGTSRDLMAAIGQGTPVSRTLRQADADDLETANEELESTNDELRWDNEELLGANDELETARDEMQSLNEELQAVNGEMQGKIEELSQTSDDMLNLLNSTDLAVLFLDAELKVKRYTMQATKLFNLIPSDVGRPIADLVSKLDHDRMLEDAGDVLRTEGYRQVKVRDRDGSLHLMRFAPYRTQTERVSGVVITFLDVARVQPLEHLEVGVLAALERLPVLILGQDRALRVRWAHAPGLAVDAAALVGRREEELLPRAEADLVAAMKRRVIETGVSLHAEVEMTLPVSGLTIQELWLEPTRQADGTITGVLSVALDITRIKRGEQLLHELRAERDAARALPGRPRPEA